MSEWFIDRSGQMPLFLHESRFISQDGITVGWLAGNCVYSSNGSHLGWLESGVLFDENNDMVAISINAPGYIRSNSQRRLAPNFLPRIPEPSPMPAPLNTRWRPLHGGRSNKTLDELFGHGFEDSGESPNSTA